MQHLIGLMDELCRPMPLHGMPDPAQAEQEQQGEDQDRGHPPTRIWRKASAYCEGGKRKVPAPRPAETCAEEHLADRIGSSAAPADPTILAVVASIRLSADTRETTAPTVVTRQDQASNVARAPAAVAVVSTASP